MKDRLTPQQKKDIGKIFKEYLRGSKCGYQKIKRIANKDDRDKAFLNAYKLFSRSKIDAFKVAEIYGFRICPYCNINYTYVVSKGKKLVCRPDFDHFVKKTDCPQKALNVLNLVPCCQQCNSRIKGKKIFSLRTHIHPHYDDFDACFKFDYGKKNAGILSLSNLTVKLTPLKELDRTHRFISDMELEARYQHHKDVVMTIIDRARRYPISSANFMKIYSKLFAKKDLIDLIYPELSCSMKNDSLGKLKKDIAKKVYRIMKSGGKL